MVVTRRSAANASTAEIHLKSKGEDNENQASLVLRRSKRAKNDVPATPMSKSSHTTIEDTLESTSDYDVSMTSPSTSETPKNSTKNISLPLREPNDIPHPSIEPFVPLFQPLAPKSTNSKGSANNPIVVIEDSPPSSTTVATRHKRQPESHGFIHRYSKLYTYRPTRSRLAPKPVSGSTFTGHKSHDVYRMMNANLAWMGYEGNGACNHDGGYGAQYPRAQYAAQQHSALDHPYNQYHHQQPASIYAFSQHATNQYFIPQHLDEAFLRQKAAQYVRNYSCASTHRKCAPMDPEQVSTPKSAERMIDESPYQANKYNLNIFNDDNKNNNSNSNSNTDHLTHLTQQSALLTQLLKCYPHSTDPAGLREDIHMFISAQKQQLEAWISNEAEREENPTNVSVSLSMSVSLSVSRAARRNPKLTEDMAAQKLRDEQVRRFLSAGAPIWQDGSGTGVADVYAEEVTEVNA